MKAGIISDTHDNTINVSKVIDIFSRHKVSYIFHAGDITLPLTAGAFSNIAGAKFISVFGNCDIHKNELKEKIESFGGQIGSFYTGQINGKRIFMTHTLNNLPEQAKSGKYDIIIYGHTHKPDIRRIGSTLIINPGKAGGNEESCVVIMDFDRVTCKTINLNNKQA